MPDCATLGTFDSGLTLTRRWLDSRFISAAATLMPAKTIS